MAENLKRLVEELRRETCPQRVLDEVARRRAGSAPSRFRFAGAVAVVAAVVLAGSALWRRPEGGHTGGRPDTVAPVAMDPARAARQAEAALACLGAALRETGARSGEVIWERAVPPLRNSLQAVKNKIINDK